MAAATAAPFTLSHRSVASWAARTEPLLGETASQERASATALLFPLRRVQRKFGERKRLPSSPRRWRWCGRKHGSPRRRRARCVERILRRYASWQNLDRSKKRSAEANLFQLESRESPEFLTGADDAFRHRARGTPSTSHGGRGSAGFPAGPALPGWTRGIMQGVDQSLADRERRRLERGGVLKRFGLTGACQRLPRAAHRAWVQATKKRTVVTTDGTRTSFRAQEYPLNRPVPKRRRTPIMKALVPDMTLNPDLTLTMTPSPS
ncbi:hypothetical protein GWK47_020270 [Chionoecetes opilio]|uniref:Uncharacterized protein n=1 Tax=Chionoecetes opilio TaxID=41210 RepID=A0A8J4XPC0_CHIOP|nr:hypothetical protein GWK47_020270 [Chionoecetes opilio]